ncbi:MAG TPA: hypothetical protein VLZ50_06985 [Terracidiphilus sp.]|nr:hypothetical protein [Terracidiphilus sp.]
MSGSSNQSVPTSDGTRELIQWGGSILGAGVLATLLLFSVLGGVTHTGATTNTGWFAVIVALTCIPFGGMLLTLGVAKWLRKRRLQRKA